MAKPKKVKSKPRKTTIKARPKPRDALTIRLFEAIDIMQDMNPGSVTKIVVAPQSVQSHTPWKLAVRFIQPGGTTYDDVFMVLRDWRDDRKLERKVSANRLTRIVVRYRNSEGIGKHGEYTLSGIAGWELAVSRSTERVGIRDERLEALAVRYGPDSDNPSEIESIIVWFSSASVKDIKLGKKASKGRRGF